MPSPGRPTDRSQDNRSVSRFESQTDPETKPTVDTPPLETADANGRRTPTSSLCRVRARRGARIASSRNAALRWLFTTCHSSRSVQSTRVICVLLSTLRIVLRWRNRIRGCGCPRRFQGREADRSDSGVEGRSKYVSRRCRHPPGRTSSSRVQRGHEVDVVVEDFLPSVDWVTFIPRGSEVSLSWNRDAVKTSASLMLRHLRTATTCSAERLGTTRAWPGRRLADVQKGHSEVAPQPRPLRCAAVDDRAEDAAHSSIWLGHLGDVHRAARGAMASNSGRVLAAGLKTRSSRAAWPARRLTRRLAATPPLLPLTRCAFRQRYPSGSSRG